MMDKNAARIEIADQIDAQVAARDAPGATPAQKEAAQAAITRLQRARRQLNQAANDAIAGKVEQLVRDLEAVQNSHALDAGSALARSITRIRDLVSNPR